MYPIKTSAPYNPNKLNTLAHIYTTVYLGNYISGDYEEGAGSHPGVDIVPLTPNDNVYAVLPGVVVEAKSNPSEGNFVVIRHDSIKDGMTGKIGTYYSCYLHLSELGVEKNRIVAEGDVIGKTGSTGQSTGEHLHFQIDTSEALFHPYWPFTFKEARELNLGFIEAVNVGLGKENARKFTVNPLVFLQTASYEGATPKNEIESRENVVVSPAVAPTSATSSVTNGGGVNMASTTAATSVTNGGSADTISTTSTSNEIRLAGTITSQVLPFSDVLPTNTYFTAITYLKDHEIATGQDGKFSPKSQVTRGELLKMILLAGKLRLSDSSTTIFSDVPVGSSFLTYVNTAISLKAISGYPDGTFRPNNPVTRAEGLKIVLGVMQTALERVEGPVYADVGKNDWCAPYALWNRDHEVLSATGGNFHPNSPLTREEVAGIIYQAVGA